jgi:hypothetical protein
MLKVLASLFLVGALFAILTNQVDLAHQKSACEEPITYTVGSFDRRFGLSYGEFVEALFEAEAIWEEPFGRNLFSYEPAIESALPINLVYDYRQEATRELLELESGLKESESTYRTLEARYNTLKKSYDAELTSYNSRFALLERRNAQYEAQVDAWNAGPRTSNTGHKTLEDERLAINAEMESLRRLENSLNQRVREINVLVERLNRLARVLNLGASQFDAIGASRGEIFEGGVYYVDERGRGIDVYEFGSREKLIMLLAHELGHALGLDHLDDSEAIMYKYNVNSIGRASRSDLDALEALCQN